jgi:monofunctional biosynthetic peptidoglycan transglycosylase
MDETESLPRKKSLRTYRVLIALMLLAYVIVDYSIQQIPDVSKLKGCLTTTMYNVNLCPGSGSYVRLDGISDVFLHSVIVSEDAAFFTHDGIDKHEIIQSLKKNIKVGGFARGGSTITQQLIKNVFFDGEKSVSRKIQEIYLAGELEEILSKRQILERYLNVIEFGVGIYGIRAAASHYFNKHPSNLNVLESIYLVHLLPNPKIYSDGFKRGSLTEFSRDRIVQLLERLLRFKRISREQVDLAVAKIYEFPWDALDPYDHQTLMMTNKPLFTSGSEKSNGG